MHVFLPIIVGNEEKLLLCLIFICVAYVNIKDQTAPTITCRDDMTLETGSPSGTAATWTDQDFIVDDNVSAESEISIICSRLSYTLFAIGTTVVSCSATDEAGNPSEDCQFNVTVAGNNPNSFICIHFFCSKCPKTSVTCNAILASYFFLILFFSLFLYFFLCVCVFFF